MSESDAVHKKCGRYQPHRDRVWCNVLDEVCNMPDDTQDCPVLIEWGETSRFNQGEKKQ